MKVKEGFMNFQGTGMTESLSSEIATHDLGSSPEEGDFQNNVHRSCILCACHLPGHTPMPVPTDSQRHYFSLPSSCDSNGTFWRQMVSKTVLAREPGKCSFQAVNPYCVGRAWGRDGTYSFLIQKVLFGTRAPCLSCRKFKWLSLHSPSFLIKLLESIPCL